MARAPDSSLPKQCDAWCDLKATYRLLSNENVDAQAIQTPHRQRTLSVCARHEIVLCVQDDSTLSFNSRTKVKGLGRLNDKGQGMIQHSTLAVTPAGKLLGMLDQFWFLRVEADTEETRKERNERWRESEVWSEAVEHVGRSPSGCRLEASQLDDARDLERLAAIQSVVAVRLLQLRDLAGMATVAGKSNEKETTSDVTAEDPAALQRAVSWVWIEMVSLLAQEAPSQLTPRQFWLTIARRGGWLGRRHDHRPGWIVIWRGWRDIHLLVEGAQLKAATQNRARKCG